MQGYTYTHAGVDHIQDNLYHGTREYEQVTEQGDEMPVLKQWGACRPAQLNLQHGMVEFTHSLWKEMGAGK